MSSLKQIEIILSPPAAHMVGDGFRVHNFIPMTAQINMERMSPFLMMDYASEHYFAPTDTPRGVGVHPHRGFETVTLALKGSVAHHDSAGNSGEIGKGDVQWMTAGSGVLHKEYHEKKFSAKGGYFQMLQLWVNLPAKFKMTRPKYQPIENNQIPKYQLPNNEGVVDIIAGEFHGIKGAAFTFTPVYLYNVSMKQGANFTFDLPENYNTAILIVKGSAIVQQEKSALVDHLVLFENRGETITVEALEELRFVVLSGQPIPEPIAAYGPFVMNTREELIEAYNDLQKGKFGYLED